MRSSATSSRIPGVMDESSDHGTRLSNEVPMSMLRDTMQYVATHPHMFDHVSVASPLSGSMETIAQRHTLRLLCQIAGKPFLLSRLVGFSMVLKVTTNGGVSDLPTMNEVDCSAAASRIANELTRVFELADTTSRGSVWKFFRELENMIAKCETVLPQERRLQFILKTGRDSLPDPVGKHDWEALAVAERAVFRSSVLSAIVTDLNDPDEDLENSIGIAGPEYFRAPDVYKAQVIGNPLRHRLAIIHDDIGRDLELEDIFLLHVLGVWLHMIDFSGKLAKKTFCDPPGSEYCENPYEHEIPGLVGGVFSQTIRDSLPVVLAFCRQV